MTSVDFALLAVVVAFALLGARAGALRQAAHLAGLALAYFCVRPLAARLAPALSLQTRFSPELVGAALSGFLFFVLSILAAFLFARLVSAALGAFVGGRADRIGGLALGAGKGAVLAFAAASTLLVFEKPLAGTAPLPEALLKSRVLDLARRCDAFGAARGKIDARLDALIGASRDPKAMRALLADPKLQKLLGGASADWSAVKRDPRVAALLSD